MSFLKITDPSKRDQLVQELINTRKAIFQDSINEQVGNIKMYQDQSKLFKPITDKLTTITSPSTTLEPAIKELTNAVKNIPAILAPTQVPAIEAPADQREAPAEQSETPNIMGNIASEYLSKFVNKQEHVDKTFGLETFKYQDGSPKFMIGNKEVFIKGNDIVINDKVYTGTRGLWELIVSENPNDKQYNDDDMKAYEEILVTTNVMRRDDKENYPKASKSDKWKNIIKPIWDKNKQGKAKASKPKTEAAAAASLATASTKPTTSTTEASTLGEASEARSGTGLASLASAPPLVPSSLRSLPLVTELARPAGVARQASIILPSDPNALLQKLDLLLASKQAGNTGVRNEAVAICDELKRQNKISDVEFKELNIIISK